MNADTDQSPGELPSKEVSSEKLAIFLKEANSGTRRREKVKRHGRRSPEILQRVMLVIVALIILIGVALCIDGVAVEMADELPLFTKDLRR